MGPCLKLSGQLFGRSKPMGQSGLEIDGCCIHITHMFNVLSYIIGIISLVIVIPATIPFLGWANWIALPLIVIGLVIGQISSSDGGRNFCLVVLLIAAIRLMIGGGII